MMNAGRIEIYKPDHAKARQSGVIFEHTLIAEKALGHPLPLNARIHHVNEDPSDNRGSNLIICENQAYHLLLHQRMRAYVATGNANAIKCEHCKEWGLFNTAEWVSGMRASGKSLRARHKICHAEAERKRKVEKQS